MSENKPSRRLLGRLRKAEGFSLTEVLMASLLLMVVLAAVYGIWFGLQRTYAFTDDDLKAQEEARQAMAEMVEFIRTAREPDGSGYPSADILDAAIVRAEPNALICWADVDRDSNHDLELVRFRVDLVERTLYRDTRQHEDVTDLSFPEDDTTMTRLVGNWVSNTENALDSSDWLFNYVGMNGAELEMTPDGSGKPIIEDPTQIREVHIRLKVDVILDKAPVHHELNGVVQPRNLRSY